MNWLSRYYDRRVGAVGHEAYLRQVGHTEGGKPIAPEKLDAMLGSVRDRLELEPGDALLDLCCGNGLVTHRLAAGVARAMGVDFSAELVRIAQANFSGPNIDYRAADVRALDVASVADQGRFDKVLMNAALQHFTPDEFREILRGLMAVTTDRRRFLFSFVPDLACRAEFDARIKPGLALRLRRLVRRDLLGSWWRRSDIARIAEEFGLAASFLPVEPALAAAFYRMDVVITPGR